MKQILTLITILAVLATACKKESSTEQQNYNETKKVIVTEIATNVIIPIYSEMNTQANFLFQSIQNLNQNTTDSNLLICQTAWYNVRNAWEKSEGFLFGPVSVENIDPRIDTWPVNYQSLDSVLTNNADYSQAYIESLEDALRGFHPIEYLLFGKNKSRKASDFTQRQKDYLLALTTNLKSLCNTTITEWNNGFYTELTNPKAGGIYGSEREVYEEITNALIGICDEVANGKIKDPFIAVDPSLEESPFALNSITDFKNNMNGVQAIYYGKYAKDGKGIEDFVRLYNLSLDSKIKQHFDAVNTSLNNITMPFGEAINKQPNQVQNAINAIDELKVLLEDELLPLIKLHTNQ